MTSHPSSPRALSLAGVLALGLALVSPLQAGRESYPETLRRVLTKYWSVEKIPTGSIEWIAKTHGEQPTTVLSDLKTFDRQQFYRENLRRTLAKYENREVPEASVQWLSRRFQRTPTEIRNELHNMVHGEAAALPKAGPVTVSMPPVESGLSETMGQARRILEAMKAGRRMRAGKAAGIMAEVK